MHQKFVFVTSLNVQKILSYGFAIYTELSSLHLNFTFLENLNSCVACEATEFFTLPPKLKLSTICILSRKYRNIVKFQW